MSNEQDFENRELKCIDCRTDFTWSAGEQAFFQEKGFTEPPKRCPDCRQAKRARNNEV
ncbi:MAG: zinc-ribbon domain-containing protein [Acidobacteria bacterium]|nr:zinc-ribbon domain-containing protein [Acidobacteriota bacterium]